MKKYLFLLILPLLFFVPDNVYADTSITYVPSAVAYFDFCGTSNNCGSANSYAQTDTLPIYPLNFYNVNYNSFNHHSLQFSFYSPTNFNSLKAYNFKVAFNYSGDGMEKLYHTEYLNGGLYPNENMEIVQSKEITITTSNDSSDNRIVIEGSMTLKEPINVSTFMVGLTAEANGVKGSLFACSNESGAMISACGQNIVTQLSLLSIEVTPIVETDDLLLNDIVNNTRVTNEKLDELVGEFNETNEKLDDLNDSINNDDVTDAEDSASGFFNDFETNDFGLSSIITMPLEFINGLTSSTCYSLNLPLPFVDTNVTLPCMTSIYERYFGSFFTLYQTITTGFIAYGVCVNIFRLVQGFKSPDNDVVEVMEL